MDFFLYFDPIFRKGEIKLFFFQNMNLFSATTQILFHIGAPNIHDFSGISYTKFSIYFQDIGI